MAPQAHLTIKEIQTLLQPFVGGEEVPANLYEQLSRYLDLLRRWNGRTNLTAVRDPEEMVTRHFGESVFTGLKIRSQLPQVQNLLDFGSGAGFPGLPIQLVLPDLAVTLAESQGKKAAFLREAIRVLGTPTSLWSRRVEQMEAAQRFDAVTLRAVDKMDESLPAAKQRLSAGGSLIVLGGDALAATFPEAKLFHVPGSLHRRLILTP